MKSLPPSSPSMSLIAPQAEPVPAAAPTCLEDPQPAPAMPSKMPSEGNVNNSILILTFKIRYYRGMLFFFTNFPSTVLISVF